MRPVPARRSVAAPVGPRISVRACRAFVHNAVHTVQVMPPEQLLLLVVVVLMGLVFLRKAL